jgi:regulator of sigma D
MIIFRTTLGLPHLAIDYQKEKYCGISSKSTVTIPGFGKYISASKDSIDSFVRRPPLIPGSFETYDSVLGESKGNGGNKLEYREFILYDNHRAYPEYIIEFKRSVKSPKVDKNLFQKVLSVFLSQKPTSEVVNLD